MTEKLITRRDVPGSLLIFECTTYRLPDAIISLSAGTSKAGKPAPTLPEEGIATAIGNQFLYNGSEV